MKQRSLKSVFTPSLEGAYDSDGSHNEQSNTDFQAAQTENAAMALLSIMRIVIVMWLPMFTSHILFSGLTAQGVLQALPRLLIWGFLCGRRQYLQKKMKSYPIVVASGVQCIGHMTVTYGMISTSLHLPEGLVQHRAFMTQFFPMYLLAAANLYVPMPVFLMFVCPLYLTTWLIFHSLVGFMRTPSVVFALCLSAVAVYVRYYQTDILWREFQATRALQEERNVSKGMQESFRGILSSIFDASCTCSKFGQLREVSPQLQELLGLPEWEACAAHASKADEMACTANLCSFAATDAEAARVQNFLASASSGGCNQASKIQCSLRRARSSSIDVLDVHLLAIALPDRALDGREADSLFVVLEVQTSSISKEVVQEAAATTTLNPSLNSAGLEFLSHQLASPQLPSFASVQKERFLPVDLHSHAGTFECLDGHMDLGSLEDSLSYSISTRSAHQRYVITSCEVEVQTATFPTKEVGVQTAGSAGKPPLPDLDESSQQPLPTRVLGRRLPRTHHRVFSRRRYKMLPSFSATPRDVIREVIFMNVMMCINPICPRGCCLYHTLLNYLREEAKLLLKHDPCKSWDSGGKDQCAACFVLQEKDDDEEHFICGHCTSDRACGHQVSDMSSTPGSMDLNSE